MRRTLIHNAIIVNEDLLYNGFVIIDDDKISDIQEGTVPEYNPEYFDKIIDFEGDYLLPGVIDDHVHFRDPGLTHKADIASESQAAVAGGVTSYFDMPNTIPMTTTIEALDAKIENASNNSIANFSFYIGATNSNIDVLKSIDYNKVCGVKLFLGSSTGNMLVDQENMISRIFSEVPALIAIHAEDENTIRKNREKFINQYGNDLNVKFHPLIRSTEACYKSTRHAVELAKRYNTRLHILHLSTEKELSLLNSSPISGKRITAEACVAHLWFCDKDYATKGNMIKCNPAIKTESDRTAIREALLDGRIDVIGTDHAPHLWNEKQGSCLTAASGMPSIQFSLLMMLELSEKRILTLPQIVRKMSHNPATIFNISRRGFLRKGYYADIVRVHHNVEGSVVTKSDILSKCRWSPLEGEIFHHDIKATFVNGNMIYSNGEITSSIPGQLLKFD